MSALIIPSGNFHSFSVLPDRRSGSEGTGSSAEALERVFKNFRKATPSTDSGPHGGKDGGDLKFKLESALFSTKTMVSRVSMHLTKERRSSLFKQMEMIFDADAWEDDEPLPSSTSFTTFLRFFVSPRVNKNPMLGMSTEGMILAGWQFKDSQLSMKFWPDDIVVWNVRTADHGNEEYAGGRARLARVWEVLAPYEIARWIGNES